MNSIVLFIAMQGVILGPIWAENCDHLGVLLYEDLGCTPHKKDETSCPTKFTCDLEKKDTECKFRGRKYRIDEKVNNTEVSPYCRVECRCKKGSTFDCVSIECPEFLGVPPTLGCYDRHVIGRCCRDGEICPPFDDSIKCVVDGQEYKEGQRFSLPDSCSECVCQKGFKGKLEAPFCQRQTCGTELYESKSLEDKCAPIFSSVSNGLKCCPPSWLCPTGSEEITGTAKSDDTCMFGSKTMKVGQSFTRTNVENEYGRKFEEVKCECAIPPLLTCLEVN